MKTFMIALIVIISSGVSIQAATSFYGFGAIATDSTDGNYELKRVRCGAKNVMSDTTLSQQVEYNFATNSIVYANVRKDFYLGETKLSVIAGRYLACPQYLWDGAKTVQTPRWSVMQGQFTSFSNGIYAEYRYYALVSRFAHAKNASAAMSLAGLSFVWEDHKGYGITIDTSLYSILHPSLGYMHLTNGKKTFYAQSYVQVIGSLRGYVLVDLGNFGKGGLAGLTYTYAPDSFLKLYYDSRRNDNWVAEAAFSF